MTQAVFIKIAIALLTILFLLITIRVFIYRPGSKKEKFFRVLGWTLILIGILSLVGIADYYFQERIFLKHSILTIGKIEGNSKGMEAYHPRISFLTSKGKPISTLSTQPGQTEPGTFEKGDIVGVYYGPLEPQDAQVQGFYYQWGYAIDLIPAALFFSFFGYFILYLSSRPDKFNRFTNYFGKNKKSPILPKTITGTKKKVSSNISIVYKILLPLLWVPVFLIPLFFIFGFFGPGLQLPWYFPLIYIPIIIIFFLIPGIIWFTLIRLKDIWVDEDYIYISSLSKEISVEIPKIEKISIPFVDIISIFNVYFLIWKGRFFKIQLKEKTPFGKKINFLADTKDNPPLDKLLRWFRPKNGVPPI